MGMVSPQTKTWNICYPYFVNLPRGAIWGYLKKVIITSISVSLQPNYLSVLLVLSFSSSYWASKPQHSGPMEQESPHCVNRAPVLPNCETDWIWTCVWTFTSIPYHSNEGKWACGRKEVYLVLGLIYRKHKESIDWGLIIFKTRCVVSISKVSWNGMTLHDRYTWFVMQRFILDGSSKNNTLFKDFYNHGAPGQKYCFDRCGWNKSFLEDNEKMLPLVAVVTFTSFKKEKTFCVSLPDPEERMRRGVYFGRTKRGW